MRLTDEQRQMVTDNIGLAQFVAGKYAPNLSIEYDECLSICYLTLVLSVQKYNHSIKKIKFSTYAVNKMRFELLKVAYPKNKTTANTQNFEYIFPGMRWEHIAGTYDIEEDIIHQIAQEQIKVKVCNLLSGKSRALFIACYDNPHYTYKEICQLMGCSEDLITYIHRSLRNKLVV